MAQIPKDTVTYYQTFSRDTIIPLINKLKDHKKDLIDFIHIKDAPIKPIKNSDGSFIIEDNKVKLVYGTRKDYIIPKEFTKQYLTGLDNAIGFLEDYLHNIPQWNDDLVHPQDA